MKGKKTMLILIPTVIGIWGLIIWKIINAGSDNIALYSQQQKVLVIEEKPDVIDYTLLLNYRDPFIGKINLNGERQVAKSKIQHPVSSQTNEKPKTLNNQNIEEVIWPNVTYVGKVEKANSSQKIGILIINDNNYIIKESQEVDKITVKGIHDDSIELEYHKTTKIFYKK